VSHTTASTTLPPPQKQKLTMRTNKKYPGNVLSATVYVSKTVSARIKTLVLSPLPSKGENYSPR
jgi:hypothetical protein